MNWGGHWSVYTVQAVSWEVSGTGRTGVKPPTPINSIPGPLVCIVDKLKCRAADQIIFLTS